MPNQFKEAFTFAKTFKSFNGLGTSFEEELDETRFDFKKESDAKEFADCMNWDYKLGDFGYSVSKPDWLIS